MVIKRLATMVIVALFILMPTANAQSDVGINNPETSTPTDLYFHIFDTFNRFPINVQPMDAEFFEVGGTNFPTVGTAGYDFNTIYGYSTAGPVEYDYIENGRPRTHPERGIAADVLLDDAVQPTGYIYLDVRDFVGLNEMPNALPSFTVEITMREGDNFGDVEALNQGSIIMQGKMTAHVADLTTCELVTGSMCVSDANGVVDGVSGPDGHPILTPDEDGIIEFAIPMELEQSHIPKADAFNVRLDWYQNPTGDPQQDDQFAEGYFRLVADTEHLPRLNFNILNPVYIDFIHPQVSGNVLLIHTGVNSPWGTYDLDAKNVTLTIDGPSQPIDLRQVVSQNTHRHGAHDTAAELTFLWNFREEAAESGEYTISMAVSNLNQTATATGTALFTIEGKKAFGVDDQGEVVEATEGLEGGDDANKDTPSIAIPVILGALIAVALIFRNKRGEQQ